MTSQDFLEIKTGNRLKAQTDDWQIIIDIIQQYENKGILSDILMRQVYSTLTRCMTRFDPSQGIPFKIYVAFWLKYDLACFVGQNDTQHLVVESREVNDD